MKTNASSRTGMWSPQAEWVPCCQIGAGLVPAQGRGTLCTGGHPQPVLCSLWATRAPSQIQPGSALVAESCCANMCQPGGTWKSPLCLIGVTMALAFLPGLMDIENRDATLFVHTFYSLLSSGIGFRTIFCKYFLYFC